MNTNECSLLLQAARHGILLGKSWEQLLVNRLAQQGKHKASLYALLFHMQQQCVSTYAILTNERVHHKTVLISIGNARQLQFVFKWFEQHGKSLSICSALCNVFFPSFQLRQSNCGFYLCTPIRVAYTVELVTPFNHVLANLIIIIYGGVYTVPTVRH